MASRHRIALGITGMALALSACGSGGESTTAAPATTARPTTTPVEDPVPAGREALPIVDRAAGDITLPLEAGTTYWSEGLGLTFDAEDRWYVQVHTPYSLTLAQPTSTGPGDREISITRATSLVDPGYLGPPIMDSIDPDADLWPVGDLDGWMAAAVDLAPSPPAPTTVGGRESVRFTLDPVIPYCQGEDRCGTAIALDDAVGSLDRADHQPITTVASGTTTNVWWIPRDGSTVLVITASGSDPDLLASAEALIASVQLDDG